MVVLNLLIYQDGQLNMVMHIQMILSLLLKTSILKMIVSTTLLILTKLVTGIYPVKVLIYRTLMVE